MDDHTLDDGTLDDDTVDRDLLRLARSVQADDHQRLEVPSDLWSRIEAQVAAEAPAAAPAELPTAEPAQPPTGRPASGTVTPIGAARRRRILRFGGLAGVVAVAASLAVAVWLVGRDSGDGREVAAVALSNEGLAPFPVVPHGTARLVEDGGRLYLDLAVEDVPDVGAEYIEIWLIDRNVQGMVSLGPYHGRDRYEVPTGVDPGAFPVVDVSVEPVDGVPTHSGVSVVRGVLPV